MSDISANLATVLDQIARAATKRDGAKPPVTLVAVSKTHAAETIRPALAAGHRVFGENRVQEAKEKWPALRHDYPDVELHLIGPLQTNKVREAVALFDVIESVDRPKLARVLAEEMKRAGRFPKILIQVNIGREPQKAGIDPDQADALIQLCRTEYSLDVIGVMCIPPSEDDPDPYFQNLADIARRNRLDVVSMGMSGDYPVAIACGATHVRVGSAIFGHRPQPM